MFTFERVSGFSSAGDFTLFGVLLLVGVFTHESGGPKKLLGAGE